MGNGLLASLIRMRESGLKLMAGNGVIGLSHIDHKYLYFTIDNMRESGLKYIGPWVGMGYSKYLGGKWVIGQFD